VAVEEDGIAIDVDGEEVTVLELGTSEEVTGSTEQLINKVMNTIGMIIFIWINTFLPWLRLQASTHHMST
jgi:hypothetical protein